MLWIDWERSRPPSDGHADTAYCHATYRTFLRVMRDFRDFYLVQDDPAAISRLTRQLDGRRLSLGIPHTWFLEIRPPQRLPVLPSDAIQRLSPEVQDVIPVGVCVVLCTDGPPKEPGFVVFMGPGSRLYLYDPETETLVLVAAHLDHLARFGLIQCECLYRFEGTPYATRYPEDVVNGLVSRSTDFSALSSFIAARSGTDINLHTPARRARCLKLFADRERACEHWPFAAIPSDELQKLWNAVTLRLCCRWVPLGLIGGYRYGGLFHGSYLLVIDIFCSIYAVAVSSGEFIRIADDVCELLKGGLTRFHARRRYQPWELQKRRLDPEPLIAYPPRESWRRGPDTREQDNVREFSLQLDFLCREGRFRPDMLRTRDVEDANVIRRTVRSADRSLDASLRAIDEFLSDDELNDSEARIAVHPPAPRERLLVSLNRSTGSERFRRPPFPLDARIRHRMDPAVLDPEGDVYFRESEEDPEIRKTVVTRLVQAYEGDILANEIETGFRRLYRPFHPYWDTGKVFDFGPYTRGTPRADLP